MTDPSTRHVSRGELVVALAVAAVSSALLVVLGQWRYLPAYWCGAAAVAAIWWFITDVGARITPVSWDLVAPPPRRAPQGDDARATRLSSRLADLGEEHSDPAVVYKLLVGLIDERLQINHGIERRNESEGLAARHLSPILRDFVRRQPPTKDLRSADYLSRLVVDIETL